MSHLLEIKLEKYYNSRLLINSRDLTCLLIDDLYQAICEGFHICFLTKPGPRLIGKVLSAEYSAISALSLKVEDVYYYVLITKTRQDIKMFSLDALLQYFSVATYDCIFLSISQPQPACFLSIDLFFCGGSVFHTPSHWDYCLPLFNLKHVQECDAHLTRQDFILLEYYFK